MAPSLFADWRHGDRTDDRRRDDRNGRIVVVEGRIRDIDRERNGFVIDLDRERLTVIAPANVVVHRTTSRGAVRARQLERGDVIRVRGRHNGRGAVVAASIDLLHDRDGRAQTIRGVVESFDRTRDVVWLREQSSGRSIAVEVERMERGRDGYDIRALRRGDHVVVRGEWRNGRFEAYDFDRGRW